MKVHVLGAIKKYGVCACNKKCFGRICACKITDSFETLCCNIRNVKSNYLICIAPQCLSPPCVLTFLMKCSRIFSKAGNSNHDTVTPPHDTEHAKSISIISSEMFYLGFSMFV